MSAPIAAYLDELKRRGAAPLRVLRPGAPDAGRRMAAAFPELSAPADLLALWRLFDGLSYHQPSTSEQAWLEGAFYTLSEAQAVTDYEVCSPLWRDDPKFEEYWPKGLFPFATPGDGSRLLVNCIAASPTHGAVYELFHGIGVSKCAPSISQYFATASAWLEQGGVHLDARACVVRDFEKASNIAARLNPGCDAWDDTLPRAYDVKDWLP